MTVNSRNDLGKMLRQRRLMAELTLSELAARSGVSQSHLARMERGERFPSGHILRKIAKPLGLVETELLTLAGYLSPQPSQEGESLTGGQPDPYVVSVLSREPAEIQRTIIGILTILKSIAKGIEGNIGFREFARRKYPELDEDVITMIDDILEHPPKGGNEKSTD